MAGNFNIYLLYIHIHMYANSFLIIGSVTRWSSGRREFFRLECSDMLEKKVREYVCVCCARVTLQSTWVTEIPCVNSHKSMVKGFLLKWFSASRSIVGPVMDLLVTKKQEATEASSL